MNKAEQLHNKSFDFVDLSVIELEHALYSIATSIPHQALG